MKKISREDVFKSLLGILKMANTQNDLDVTKISENDNLTLDLGLTSVGALYVAIAIEEAFNIEFDDVTFNDFKTVKDVVDFIESKLK